MFEPLMNSTFFHWPSYPLTPLRNIHSDQIEYQMLQIENQIRPVLALKEPSQIHQ